MTSGWVAAVDLGATTTGHAWPLGQTGELGGGAPLPNDPGRHPGGMIEILALYRNMLIGLPRPLAHNRTWPERHSSWAVDYGCWR